MNSSSLNDIAFNLLNTLRGGRSSNTEHISLDQIKYMIKYYRSTFIRRDLDRNFNRLTMFEQDLGPVAVSLVDTAEDGSVTSGVNLNRTDKLLPTPVRLKMKPAITHISSADKVGKPIPLLNPERAYWQQFGAYTDSDAFAFFRNGYLYIDNDDDATEYNIRGIFEDPEQVHEFTRDNGLDLYNEDSPFPISTDMLEGITKGLINGELRLIAEPQANDVTTDTLQGQ